MVKQETRSQTLLKSTLVVLAAVAVQAPQQGVHQEQRAQVMVQTGTTTGDGVPALGLDGVMAQVQGVRPMGLAGVLALVGVQAAVQDLDTAMVSVEAVPLEVDMVMELEVVPVVMQQVAKVQGLLRLDRHLLLGKGTPMRKEIVLGSASTNFYRTIMVRLGMYVMNLRCENCIHVQWSVVSLCAQVIVLK